MNNWVLSSNPNTMYHVKESLDANGEMDWISENKDIKVGDIVYIYEVLPPRGKGGIVCKTQVTRIGLTLDNKINDVEFWVKDAYLKYFRNESRFNRLRRVSPPIKGIIPYQIIQTYGFVAPQRGVYSLDKKPELLKYIQECFL